MKFLNGPNCRTETIIPNFFLFTIIHWMKHRSLKPNWIHWCINHKRQSYCTTYEMTGFDNMYLIWGAAYYLRKDFDSAFLTFQFINYAFAPKEKDGYYKYIGSKMDGNTVTNIATKEKTPCLKEYFLNHPAAMMPLSGRYGLSLLWISRLKLQVFWLH